MNEKEKIKQYQEELSKLNNATLIARLLVEHQSALYYINNEYTEHDWKDKECIREALKRMKDN